MISVEVLNNITH